MPLCDVTSWQTTLLRSPPNLIHLDYKNHLQEVYWSKICRALEQVSIYETKNVILDSYIFLKNLFLEYIFHNDIKLDIESALRQEAHGT